MKAASFTFLPSLAVLLVACAGVSPTNLKPSTAGHSIVLSSPVEYDQHYAFAGNRFFYAIGAGKYSSKYEDSSGRYYEGPNLCFTIRIEMDSLKKDGKPQPAPHAYRCGIYVPTDTSLEPKLYFYRDPEVSKAIFAGAQAPAGPPTSPAAGVGGAIGVSLAEAFDAAEMKNLHFYQDQPRPGQIRRAMQ